MDYLHIKNLEKYHPSYKDRKLVWAKIYVTMVQGDPDCERITSEVDWCRLIKFILLELQAQKPVPLDLFYLTKKGFDFKRRYLKSTLEALSEFIQISNDSVTKPLRKRAVDKDKDKDKDKEVEIKDTTISDEDFLKSLKTNLAYKDIEIDKELAKMDAWLATRPGRKKTKRFIINWLNKIDTPIKRKGGKWMKP